MEDFEKRLSRKTDPSTSADAAKSVAPHLNLLQTNVLAMFTLRGPMTAEQCERYFVTAIGPSTVRTRICELRRLGKLIEVGREKNARGRTVIRYGVRGPLIT